MNGRIDHYVKIIEESIGFMTSSKDFTEQQFRSSIDELKRLIKTRYDFLNSHQEISEVGFTNNFDYNQTKVTSFNDTSINVKIRTGDQSEIGDVYLYHTPKGRIDPYTVTQMYDDGNHEDGRANDGIFGASIPGYPSKERSGITLRHDQQINQGRPAFILLSVNQTHYLSL